MSGAGGGGGGRIKIVGYVINMAGTINVSGGVGGIPAKDGLEGENGTAGSSVEALIPEFHSILVPIIFVIILIAVSRKRDQLINQANQNLTDFDKDTNR